MIKRIALFCALVGVLALMAGSAYAEVQNIKVSGDIQAMGVFRDNYDLEDKAFMNPLGLGLAPSTPIAGTEDNDSMFVSVTRLRVDADLTDNVSAAVRLANLREWDVAATPGEDIVVDLAYVTLKEMLYSPLTLVIGRQELNYGNGLVVGYGRYQDSQGTLAYADLSPMHGYDAIRAILDYDPWTMDLVLSKITEADDGADAGVIVGAGKDSDIDLYGVNLGYKFDSYEGEMEGYVWYERDELYGLTTYLATGTADRIYEESDIVTAGLRGSYAPMDNLTLGGEIAGQWGEIKDEDQRDAPGVPSSLAVTRDVQSMLGNAYLEYDFADTRFMPTIGLEYLYTSGEEIDSAGEAYDTSDFSSWDPLFRGKTMGVIRDCLEALYTTNDPADTSGITNQHTIKASCGLDLGELVDGLSLDLAYLHYWFDECPSLNLQDDDIGGEVNMTLTYDYTEDVQFFLDGAWFMPGDYYDNVHTVMTMQGLAVNFNGDAVTNRVSNDTAVSVIGACKVTF